MKTTHKQYKEFIATFFFLEFFAGQTKPIMADAFQSFI
jgi:hypothetical protein